MEILIYLAKASFLLSVFWAIYKLFLSKESFLLLNRFFLIIGILISFSLPLKSFTQIELIEIEIFKEETPFYSMETVAPQIAMAYPMEMVEPKVPSFWETLAWEDVVLFIYGLGLILFLGKFFWQTCSLVKLLRKAKKRTKNGIVYYETTTPIEAFSFCNIMVYNPEMHSKNELEMVKTHETIHIKEVHSLDMLLGNLACIVLWFLPFAYLFRKAVDQNLEYIADAKTVQQMQSVKKYQYTLLNYFSLENKMEYASYFFKQSSLKNRIMMLNQKNSSRINLIKYSFILPFLLCFIWLFQIESIAKEVYVEVETPTEVNLEDEKPITSSNSVGNTELETKGKILEKDSTSVTSLDEIKVKINKETDDKVLKEMSELFAEYDVKLNFSRVKRNKEGEITRIKIRLEDKENGIKDELMVSGNQPIKEYELSINFKENKAEIAESQVPEKDIYTLLNEAKTIIINGIEYDKNKPVALTDIKIKKKG